MKKQYILIIFLVFVNMRVVSQNSYIGLELYIEGKKTTLNSNFEIKVISLQDTLSLQSCKEGFYFPDSLNKKERTILFEINSHELVFTNIPLIFNAMLPKWMIHIDYFPFMEENLYLVEGLPKKIKWIYTLQNGLGSIITEYRFKKHKFRKR